MFKREGDLASGFEAVASASDVLELNLRYNLVYEILK